MKDKRKIEILDKFFDSSITTDFNKSLYTNCYSCYEEMTADGYEVCVFQPPSGKICINEDVHFYNDDVCEAVLYIYEHDSCFIYVEADLAEKIYLRSSQLELFEEYLPDILKSDLLTKEEHEELLENEEY